jgi:hypothetical protein
LAQAMPGVAWLQVSSADLGAAMACLWLYLLCRPANDALALLLLRRSQPATLAEQA